MVNVAMAIFWVIYLVFTIKTFIEIHRQTELQSEAFLMVACEKVDSLPEKTINKVNETSILSHSKWTEIIKNNILRLLVPTRP